MRQKEPYVAFFDKKVFALFSPLSSAKSGSPFLDREYISKLTRIRKGVNSKENSEENLFRSAFQTATKE